MPPPPLRRIALADESLYSEFFMAAPSLKRFSPPGRAARFPFTAIVGLEQAKRSLIYQAIDCRLGGTLLFGHGGCAKSTLARSFAALLPAPDESQEGRFIEVPLGTTEDRLLGSVDPTYVVENSKWKVRPGLIEDANGGVLYIDEINLFPDHLADFILDSASTGQYRMERDGFTRMVRSQYVLIGSMNPEEGVLRPQLMDRFAHGVLIRDDFSAQERMQIVKRRMDFDDDPALFCEAYMKPERDLRERIRKARIGVRSVLVSDEIRMRIAGRAKQLALEGMRAELAVLRTARCSAAWQEKEEIGESDLAEAWELCLGHRTQDNGTSPQADRFPMGRGGEGPIVRSEALQGRAADERKRFHLSRGPACEYSDKRNAAEPVAWLVSLLVSLDHGWRQGVGAWHLRYLRLQAF